MKEGNLAEEYAFCAAEARYALQPVDPLQSSTNAVGKSTEEARKRAQAPRPDAAILDALERVERSR